MYKNIFAHDEWKRAEHMAVRENVGYYLFTHQIMEVTGEDACRFLDYIYPNNIASLAINKDRYTTMLNEEGEIIDDEPTDVDDEPINDDPDDVPPIPDTPPMITPDNVETVDDGFPTLG